MTDYEFYSNECGCPVCGTFLIFPQQEQLEQLENAIQKIRNWCNAYPLDVFPEPDFKEVQKLFGPKLLTEVSASNMRHVINGVRDLLPPERSGE
jgi:hypothetical protein